MEPPHKSNAVIPPRTIKEKDQIAHEDLLTPGETDGGDSSTLVLDLSGDKNAVSLWGARRLSGRAARIMSKSELKWSSGPGALRIVSSLKPRCLVIFTSDIKVQSQTGPMLIFGALAGARKIIIADQNGNEVVRTKAGAIFLEGPRVLAEFLLGFGLIIPVTWALTLLLNALLGLRKIVRASRGNRERDRERTTTRALYLRATPVAASPQVETGGMIAHTAGFTRGALEIGHRLSVIASASAGFRDARLDLKIARPSSAISATRSLFEIWNNLTFTAAAIKSVEGSGAEFDFLYQRYSRFNWTGVALSLLTGLPLALEFNGSEVWVSRNWDPIGQLKLLVRIEKLNLRAADLIFVVSEVQRRSLIDRGVPEEKIKVNPNGVSIEDFHPLQGGAEVRRELGVEDKIVVGFTGTFGPWHGAPILAQAAAKAAKNSNIHLILVGDGDERDKTERIVRESGVSATFAGRVARDQVPGYLDACDILVSPHVRGPDGSDFFGSPTKLFEYMAMARPVIASRLGQPADIIKDGQTGLLVEPGSAQDLALAIEKLARDEALRARLGRGAREAVAAQYTWRHNAARVFQTIEEMA
jgi:glycosyltransferase involved in cell wall biosynthesis